MANPRVKVAITGPGGHIGYALLFRIASGQMFGPDVELDLHLLELEAALPALDGVVMELDDCAFPLLKNVLCTSNPKAAMSEANWVILVGAVPRKAGMERGDLLKINGGIFTAQGKAINDHAADDVRTLVVGNPCNTNCLIAMNNAPDVPNDRFFAMTMLDELRAKTQLAKRANVDITAVTNTTIWGNHSATQFPDFYNAKINGDSAFNVINDKAWFNDEFVSQVQQRGAAVIKARGASSAASAANAIVQSVYNLTHPTPTGDSFSMCRCSTGEYGIDEGLIFSFPCFTAAQGELNVITDLTHNDDAQQRINTTHEELRAERDTVKSMGLID